MHRVRWAMAGSPGGAPLTGIVEVDETYIGGKVDDGERTRQAIKGAEGKRLRYKV